MLLLSWHRITFKNQSYNNIIGLILLAETTPIRDNEYLLYRPPAKVHCREKALFGTVCKEPPAELDIMGK